MQFIRTLSRFYMSSHSLTRVHTRLYNNNKIIERKSNDDSLSSLCTCTVEVTARETYDDRKKNSDIIARMALKLAHISCLTVSNLYVKYTRARHIQ